MPHLSFLYFLMISYISALRANNRRTQVKLVVTLEGVSPIPDDQPKTVWADVASWIQDKLRHTSNKTII